jgi:TetR/AcrR family transcriptional regulator
MVKPDSSTRRSKPEGPSPDPETRERILDAAHVVFTRKGTAGSRTQEIADEAGVNKALVHYYFGTKAELADAIFERALATLMPLIWGILGDPALSLEQKVRAVVRAQMDFHPSRPYFAGYLVAELHAQPDRIARIMVRRGTMPIGVLRKQLRQEARAGRIRSMSAEQFVATMMGLLIFPFAVRPALCQLLQLDAARWDAFVEERRRQLPGFILAGLRP